MLYLCFMNLDHHNSVTPNFDKIDPRFCINARLRRLHRMLNSVYMSKFKPFGLRGSMVAILFIVGKMKNINQKTVAERLVLDQSTMSRDIKKLKERGLVEVRKGADSRNSSLSLTTKGYELIEQIAPIWEDLHKKMEQILGTHNLQQIDLITNAVQSNLDKL